MKCHSFKWFIDNVYGDAPFPNGDLYLGQVRLPELPSASWLASLALALIETVPF